MNSKKKILSQFGLYEKQKNQAWEEARLLALSVLGKVDRKHQALKGSKDFLEGVYHYLGAVMKYVLYLEKRKEGNYIGNVAAWKRNLLNNLSPRVLDHPRTLGKYLISYPYSLELNDLEKIVNICKAWKLDLKISGDSEYFPGHTFKIIINKKKEKH
jgi:hypothetical protein